MIRLLNLIISFVISLVILLFLSDFVLARENNRESRAEERYFAWSGVLPACEDPSVLGYVSSSFATKEAKFWNSSLTIVSYETVTLRSNRPWGKPFLPRAFCTARATLSDGSVRRVDYAVREDLGFAGYSWDVDWCVTGLDRHSAKEPSCRMAQP
jgi:hypothetical protein